MAHSIHVTLARFRQIKKFLGDPILVTLTTPGLQGEVEGIFSGAVAIWEWVE